MARNPRTAIAGARAAGTPQRFAFPDDIETSENNLVSFGIMEAEASITGSVFSGGTVSLSVEKTYVLPLPKPLTDMYPVKYDTNFSFTQAALQTLGVAGSAGGLIDGPGGRAAQAATGTAVNQYRMVTLAQPEFRRHQLNWKLAPRTPEESLALARIIHSLRVGMTPDTFGESRILLLFPKIYLLFFIPNVQYMYKFKPCVLENITVTYDGEQQTPAFYRTVDGIGNNPPESLIVNTTWLELEYWIRDDYAGADGTTDLPSNDFSSVYNWYSVPSGSGAFSSPGRTTNAATQNRVIQQIVGGGDALLNRLGNQIFGTQAGGGTE